MLVMVVAADTRVLVLSWGGSSSILCLPGSCSHDIVQGPAAAGLLFTCTFHGASVQERDFLADAVARAKIEVQVRASLQMC